MGISKSDRRNGDLEDSDLRQLEHASWAHLSDLRRVHGRPPADVALESVAIPQRLTGEPVASYCTSPAQLCAELAQ